jgi:predicted acyl esterase
MSDGVALKVDVSYPTDLRTGARASGPFPVLLTQTPYLGTSPTAGDYFVQRGYIFVTAYVRGTNGSGGNFGFFSDRDAKDGAELVSWVATKLQNSNGKVGLFGGSYGGITQIFTVASLGPNSPVKAIAPACMGAEFYRETYFSGGIPTQTLNFQRQIGGAMGEQIAPFGKSFVSEVLAGGPRAYDGAFWQERTPGNYTQRLVDSGVPVLLWSSDGDIYAESSLELYAYLQNAASRSPLFGPMDRRKRASGRYQILMSQGGHCANEDRGITLEWYDTWLKDVKTGMQNTAMPLHVHEMVSNRWINTSAFPAVSTYTRYFMTETRQLLPTVPSKEGSDQIVWSQPGPQSTLQYDSPPFPNGATLAGPISASIYASSTTRNLEMIATVALVNGDGSMTSISSGAVLGSLAPNNRGRSWFDSSGLPTRPYGDYSADVYVPAGLVRKYDFAISPRFVAIPPGSRLRLTVTTQTPMSKCSGFLGTDPCFPTDPQKSSLNGTSTRLYYGRKTGSSLNLPLLPANCWQSNDRSGIPYWNEDAKQYPDSPCQIK